MFKNKLLVAAALFLVSNCVLAGKVEFSLGDTKGTFHCKVNTLNPFVTVNMTTESIAVSGFCKGQKYVEKDGQIRKMPVYELRNHYFKFKKNIYQFGSVTIENSSGEDALLCDVGEGDKSKAYGNDQYC